jgi:enamine deaminase RidA (YjgF/YER057c/UK114 family)
MKRPTSILIDENLKEQAKQAGINISRFVEEQLIDFLSKKEVYEDTIPVLLAKEIEKYAEIAENKDNWEKFATARCSMIRNKTGIIITPHRLIYLVNQKLQEVDA